MMEQDEAQEQELTRVVGNVAPKNDLVHEVRTYLDTTIGFLEIMRDEALDNGEGGLPPELENIWLASNRLAALVEETSHKV
ncbi:MAG: hypothetical protein CL902_04650 [Dehalococcoidia bacterium]|nr:hypothetical protein [Dehalococcoidia bacterium]